MSLGQGRPTPGAEGPNLDSVTTIRDDGSRRFLFPADVRGPFTRARFWVALALISLYGVLPWLPIGGYPAVFLDVAHRRFHLFGLTLAAQDLWMLFFLITGAGFSLFFITALLGRVWCGWACPQTVFLDFVYRKIERWIDGDAVKRRKLDAAPPSAGKVAKRALKHLLFFLVSAAIAHLFLAYFVSIPELWRMMHSAPTANWSVFAFVFIFAGILYFNFAWFREQLCIVICPYGRLQSVLTDDNSLVVGYDARRGEPRGRLGTAQAGDCVACNRCVQVCPTGIDIRQGLQLECIACTACIDACDEVMQKVGRKPGLVRYDSQAGLSGRKTRWLRPRTVIYALIFTLGTLGVGTAVSRFTPAAFQLTRMVGTPYIVDATSVRNQFMVRLVNKRNEPQTFRLQILEASGVVQTGLNEALTLPAMAEEVRPLVIAQPKSQYKGPFRFKLRISTDGGTTTLTREARFLGPDAALLD